MSKDGVLEFWERFLTSSQGQALVDARLYDVMRIGSSSDSADLGATLIVKGLKTATSSHPSEYDQNPGPPFMGALSIVLNGSNQPMAVVETIELELRKLNDLDDAFAKDYGEWDLTAETLKSELAAYYTAYVTSAGDTDRCNIDLICERFRVVFTDQ